jgi:non-specific serine/threonine protein kinase
LKHSKGLTYLARLLERPGGELHVCELAAAELRSGDAGPVLDARAKQDYRERLEQLRDELAESERFNDQARACRAREEIDALAAQLAAALGLGGRDRRAASDSERTRINVQRRLKNAIERIASGDAELGRYLARTIKTGSFCGYAPF